jgi:hypothetical protein
MEMHLIGKDKFCKKDLKFINVPNDHAKIPKNLEDYFTKVIEVLDKIAFN